MAGPDTKPLFTLPAGAQSSVTCTQPADKVYLLTFNFPPDNRLTTDFCQTLLLALSILQHRHPPGVLITTSAIPKFYSNGLDLAHAAATPAFFPRSLYALWHALLTYPMPTLALLNGHAFAGALMLAAFHDYRLMNPHRGFLCLNELELGVPLRPPMAAVFRQKVGAAAFRALVLEARRFAALEALEAGLVDGVGGVPEALAFVEEMALVRKAGGVYGELKREMWGETVGLLEGFRREEEREEEARLRRERERDEQLERVVEWERRERAERAKL